MAFQGRNERPFLPQNREQAAARDSEAGLTPRRRPVPDAPPHGYLAADVATAIEGVVAFLKDEGEDEAAAKVMARFGGGDAPAAA